MDLHSRRELMESMSKRYRQASKSFKYASCHDRDIGFPRSRPCKKYDNAQIVQKKWL